VTSLDIESGQAAYNPYQQTASEARIKLRTEDEEKTLQLGKSVASSLQNKEVSEGDVIQIDSKSGQIMKMRENREAWQNKEAGISVTPDVVDVPTDEIQKEREFVSTMNIHQLDTIQAQQRARGGLSMFLEVVGSKSRTKSGKRRTSRFGSGSRKVKASSCLESYSWTRSTCWISRLSRSLTGRSRENFPLS